MKKEIIRDKFTGEEYIYAVHPTGLEIYLMPRPEFASAYAVFGTRYGSVDTDFVSNGKEISVPEGIAHFLEHKLFESEDGDAFSRYSVTGASANAYTSFDRTCYLFSCADKFFDNLDILLDFVQSPYFTKETVDKEQGIIGQEIRMYDDNAPWCVMFNMLRAMYKSHPVRVDIAGTVESIAKIDKDLLYTCYNTFYNPGNMFICIAGNFPLDETLQKIEKSIKTEKGEPVIRRSNYESPEILQAYVEQKLEVSKPIFCLGYKEDCKGVRSQKDKLCSEILLDIISSNTSPLYVSLINEGLINDEIESEYFTGIDYAVSMFTAESSDPKKASDMIKAEINRLKTQGIDKREFQISKKAMWGQLVSRTEENASVVSAMVECAIYGGGLFDSLQILNDLTVSDIELALDRLSDDRCVLSVINPAK